MTAISYQSKACPVCSTVSSDVYCPRCRKAHIIVKMLTLSQIRVKIEKNIAGRGLLERAAAALEAERTAQ